MKAIISVLMFLTAANFAFAQSKPPKAAPKVATTTFPKVFKPTKVFLRDRADLHESLKIQLLSNGKIAYELTMENGGCEKFTIKGIALQKKGDMESDIDEKNNGFEVAEYTDATAKDRCGIQIRIGAEKGYTNRARFIIFDCGKMPHCADKMESEALLSQK
ncbi:MAG: hypothetical protein RIS64_823 [Bacteroidota bacterium]